MSGTGRPDGRAADELRPIDIDVGFVRSADGSALIAVGDTVYSFVLNK